MDEFDRIDLMVFAGLLLIVAAVYLLADWPGLVGLVGGTLTALGLFGARRGGQ